MISLLYLLSPILSSQIEVRLARMDGIEIRLQLASDDDLKEGAARVLGLRPSDFVLHPAGEHAYTVVKEMKLQIRRIFEENENDDPIIVYEAETLRGALNLLCPQDVAAMEELSTELRDLLDLPLTEFKEQDPTKMRFKKNTFPDGYGLIQIKHPDDDWIAEKPDEVRKEINRVKAKAFHDELNRVKNSSETFKIYRAFTEGRPDNPLVLSGETTLRDALQQLDQARFEQTLLFAMEKPHLHMLRDSLDLSLEEIVRIDDNVCLIPFIAQSGPSGYGHIRIYPDGMENDFAVESRNPFEWDM